MNTTINKYLIIISNFILFISHLILNIINYLLDWSPASLSSSFSSFRILSHHCHLPLPFQLNSFGFSQNHFGFKVFFGKAKKIYLKS